MDFPFNFAFETILHAVSILYDVVVLITCHQSANLLNVFWVTALAQHLPYA